MENKAMNQDQQIEQMEKEVIRLETLFSELKRQSAVNQSLLNDCGNPCIVN